MERGVTSEGYGFQIELVLTLDRMGYRIGEVPITFREREHGQSKISRGIVLEALVKVAAWGIHDRLSKDGRRSIAPGDGSPSPPFADEGRGCAAVKAKRLLAAWIRRPSRPRRRSTSSPHGAIRG